MRLIIERIDDDVYAYREEEEHYQVVEPQRTSRRVKPKELGYECNLDYAFDGDFHIVFKLKDRS
jgi:hypothetical protein